MKVRGPRESLLQSVKIVSFGLWVLAINFYSSAVDKGLLEVLICS